MIEFLMSLFIAGNSHAVTVYCHHDEKICEEVTEADINNMTVEEIDNVYDMPDQGSYVNSGDPGPNTMPGQ